MWETFLRAKQWSKRPSELLGITDTYHAWCFDEACATFGGACERAMEVARKPPKRSKGSKGSKLSAEQLEARAENALRKMLGMERKYRGIESLRPPPMTDDNG